MCLCVAQPTAVCVCLCVCFVRSVSCMRVHHVVLSNIRHTITAYVSLCIDVSVCMSAKKVANGNDTATTTSVSTHF